MKASLSHLTCHSSYNLVEKRAPAIELSSDFSRFDPLQKNSFIDHAAACVLQERFKQIIKKAGFEDSFIKQIPSEYFVSQEEIASYLFHRILETSSQELWKNLDFEVLLELKAQEKMDIILTGIQKGNIELITYILQKINKNQFISPKNSQNKGMLHMAAIYGHDEIMSYLLSHHLDLVNLQDKDSDGLTPFQWAIHEGHEKVVQKLLNYDVICQKWECEKKSISTLALAVASKNPAIVSLLLNSDHFKEISVNQPIHPFGSVLHLIIALNEPQMLSYLLNAQYQEIHHLLEITDLVGRTPLHLAAFLGDLFAIKELNTKGAHIHQGEGTSIGTPLHWAVKGKQPEAISLLLSLGADPSRNDEAGKNPAIYLDDQDLETPVGKRCKNLLDNFMRSKRAHKVKAADFQERPPFNIIFEGNFTALDGFISAVNALEAKKMIKDFRRYSGKGLGAIVATLLAIGYTAYQLEDISLKELEDLFKQHKDLTNQQQAMEGLYLKSLRDLNLLQTLPPLCDLLALREDLEEIIFCKTNTKYLTLGELKGKVETSPHLYKHLHLPVYSLLKKQNIFFNTEDHKYSDFVLADVLAAALSFPGLLPAASLRRKNSDGALYEDTTYGKTWSVPFDTLLVDLFDDLIYQEDPYFKGRMTNYRTCALRLDKPPLLQDDSLLSHLIDQYLNPEEKGQVIESATVGRVKQIFIHPEEVEERGGQCINNRVQMLFSAKDIDLGAFKKPTLFFSDKKNPSPWKFTIFRKNKTKAQKQDFEKKLQHIHTLPPFTIFFTGREKELKEIAEGFSHTRKVAICGLGGMGKSTLSLKYAHSLQGYEFIHFIKANALGRIKMGFIELAGLLSMKKDKAEETLAELKLHLQHKNCKGLLIIDGLDEEVYFNELNDCMPSQSKCDILISTRIEDKAKVKGFKTISLNSFMPQEAAFYLTRGQDVSLQEKTSAESLAKAAGYLPLALSHITRYLDQEKITLHQYAIRFQKRNPKLPGKDALNLPDDEVSVFITWQVSLEAIAKKEMGPLAISMMHFISTLGEEAIPLSLLVRWATNYDEQCGQYEIHLALKLLKDYAFLKDKSYEEDSHAYYETHALVQKVILYQLTEEGKYKEMIMRSIYVLNQEVHDVRRPFQDIALKEAYRLNHVYQVHVSYVSLSHPVEQIASLEDQVKFFSHLGWAKLHDTTSTMALDYVNKGLALAQNLEESKKMLMVTELYMLKMHMRSISIKDIFQMAKDALEMLCKSYPHDSEYVMYGRDRLGKAYEILKYPQKSLDEYQKVLNWQKKRFSQNNKLILSSYEKVVLALKMLGKKEKLLEAAKEMLQVQKEVLGEGYWETVNNYKQIIQLLKKLRRKEEALEMAQEPLRARKETSKEDSGYILESYRQVIGLLKEMGRKEEALQVAEESLKVRKKVLGEDHSFTSESYEQVIRLLKEFGKKEEALEVAKNMLKTRRGALGEENRLTSESYEQVIRLLKEFGKKEEALEVAKNMLKTRREALGEGDRLTSESYEQVIRLLKEFGKKEEVVAAAKEMLNARRDALGEGNSETSQSYQQLIRLLKELGKKEEALEIAKEMLKVRKEALGEEHQQTLKSYDDIVTLLIELEKKEDLFAILQERLKITKQELGKEQRWHVYYHVIEALKESGRKEEALQLTKDILQNEKDSLRKDEILSAYKMQVEVLKVLGKKEEVLEAAKEMLRYAKETLAEVEAKILMSYEDVICALKALERKEEALEMAQERLRIIKQTVQAKGEKSDLEIMRLALGENGWFHIDIYQELIHLLEELNRKEGLLEILKERLKDRKTILGEDHRKTTASYQDIIRVLKELGRKAEAVEFAQEMVKIRQQVLGEGHWVTSGSYKQLILLLEELGKKEEAVAAAKEMLKVRKEALGEGHEATCKSYKHVIKGLKELGRKEEGLELAQDMLKVRRDLLGEGSQETLEGYRQVIEALKEVGKKEEALEVAKENLKASQETLETDKQVLISYQKVIEILIELGKKEEALKVAQDMLKTWKEAVGEEAKWTLTTYLDVIYLLETLVSDERESDE